MKPAEALEPMCVDHRSDVRLMWNSIKCVGLLANVESNATVELDRQAKTTMIMHARGAMEGCTCHHDEDGMGC